MGPDHPLAQQQAQSAGKVDISHKHWRVTLLPDGDSFDCAATQPILDAAHAANHLFPYSCRGGRCGTCRGRLLHGDVEYPAGWPEALTEAEARAGFALFCSACPRSHLVVELATPSIDGDDRG